jgi:hypothetical protein
LTKYDLELLEHAPLSILWTAWQKARCDLSIPERHDLKLRDLAKISSDLVVLDKHDDGEFYIQLQGQDMADRINKSAKDTPISSLMVERVQEKTNAIFESLIGTPQGGLILFDTLYTTGKHSIVSALFLPLMDKKGTVSKLIGVYHPLELLDYKAPCERTLSGEKQLELIPVDISQPDMASQIL